MLSILGSLSLCVDSIAVWHALPITLKNQQCASKLNPCNIHFERCASFLRELLLRSFALASFLWPFSFSISINTRAQFEPSQISHTTKKVDYVSARPETIFGRHTTPLWNGPVFFMYILWLCCLTRVCALPFVVLSCCRRHSFRWARYRNNSSSYW